MQELLDIHGQHETQSLLKQKYHLTLLDNYAESRYQDLLDKYHQTFQNYKAKKARVRRFRISRPSIAAAFRFNEISIRRIV